MRAVLTMSQGSVFFVCGRNKSDFIIHNQRQSMLVYEQEECDVFALQSDGYHQFPRWAPRSPDGHVWNRGSICGIGQYARGLCITINAIDATSVHGAGPIKSLHVTEACLAEEPQNDELAKLDEMMDHFGFSTDAEGAWIPKRRTLCGDNLGGHVRRVCHDGVTDLQLPRSKRGSAQLCNGGFSGQESDGEWRKLRVLFLKEYRFAVCVLCELRGPRVATCVQKIELL